jgi:hypothetical protein
MTQLTLLQREQLLRLDDAALPNLADAVETAWSKGQRAPLLCRAMDGGDDRVPEGLWPDFDRANEQAQIGASSSGPEARRHREGLLSSPPRRYRHTMTDEITPALTPDQWRRLLHEREVAFGEESLTLTGNMLRIDDGTTRNDGVRDLSGEANWRLDLIPALLAIANAALPDEDARKFTREEVRRLAKLANLLEDQGWPNHAAPCRTLAAKISALLPPG